MKVGITDNCRGNQTMQKSYQKKTEKQKFNSVHFNEKFFYSFVLQVSLLK